MRIIRIEREEGTIEVCPHIKLTAYDIPKDDVGCEYLEHLKVHCNQCDKVYELDLWIN